MGRVSRQDKGKEEVDIDGNICLVIKSHKVIMGDK
jgi:hypothetical protein